jgi:hypothetical protein
LIRPSELAIEKRDLNEAKGIDKVIKRTCLSNIEIVIGFIAGRANKVEVSKDSYRARAREGGENLLDGGEEAQF